MVQGPSLVGREGSRGTVVAFRALGVSTRPLSCCKVTVRYHFLALLALCSLILSLFLRRNSRFAYSIEGNRPELRPPLATIASEAVAGVKKGQQSNVYVVGVSLMC
jgi:hypothetical protein